MFSPYELPKNIVLLVTDELASPADFFLHSLVGSRLKESRSYRCLIVTTLPDISRWKAIASKSHNLSIDEKVSAESLTFIDVLPNIQNGTMDKLGLAPIYDSIASILSTSTDTSNMDIILDGISTLQWLGHKSLDITRFYRAVRALCIKYNCSLFIRHHIVKPSEPDDLFRDTFQLCSHHLEVRPLSSGKSGAVSGEMALHPGPNARGTVLKPIPRSAALQFRLTDYSAVFFEKGTSNGVL